MLILYESPGNSCISFSSCLRMGIAKISVLIIPRKFSGSSPAASAPVILVNDAPAIRVSIFRLHLRLLRLILLQRNPTLVILRLQIRKFSVMHRLSLLHRKFALTHAAFPFTLLLRLFIRLPLTIQHPQLTVLSILNLSQLIQPVQILLPVRLPFSLRLLPPRTVPLTHPLRMIVHIRSTTSRKKQVRQRTAHIRNSTDHPLPLLPFLPRLLLRIRLRLVTRGILLQCPDNIPEAAILRLRHIRVNPSRRRLILYRSFRRHIPTRTTRLLQLFLSQYRRLSRHHIILILIIRHP
ncbi:hypothetical protein EVA_05919 [gut metagenome]|uniref:Uncharacterized protein n=1 Tax=gut metagenome TaxID=749906 RepID=J9GF45_9ZZZZ